MNPNDITKFNVSLIALAESVVQVWEVREQERYKGEFSPHLNVLLQYQEQAKRKCVGRWNKVSLNKG